MGWGNTLFRRSRGSIIHDIRNLLILQEDLHLRFWQTIFYHRAENHGRARFTGMGGTYVMQIIRSEPLPQHFITTHHHFSIVSVCTLLLVLLSTFGRISCAPQKHGNYLIDGCYKPWTRRNGVSPTRLWFLCKFLLRLTPNHRWRKSRTSTTY